jgi:hypothetical protein
LQHAQSGGIGQCLFAAALLLLRFEAGVGFGLLLLGVMDGAIRLGAHPAMCDVFNRDGGNIAPVPISPLDPFDYGKTGRNGYPISFHVEVPGRGKLNMVAHIWPPKSEKSSQGFCARFVEKALALLLRAVRDRRRSGRDVRTILQQA